MLSKLCFVLFWLFCIDTVCATTNSTIIFPEDFIFGVGTSAYQTEGAWDQDGKGESIWDYISHKNPSFIANEDNADVACDSYNKWEEDLQLLEDLGVDSYRLSLSWPRILPNGLSNKINLAGVKYYSKLLDGLIERGIEPLVTIYHLDLPQPLQELGGWTNPLIVNYFADYARLVFALFGDRVTIWTTMNEPLLICEYGYGQTLLAPALNMSGRADYLCGHNLLKAHATAYHIYQDEFKAMQNGSVGISIGCNWFEPLGDSDEDLEAAKTNREFNFGWFMNPIFGENYPQVMIDRIANRSAEEGFAVSRLPVLTEEEIAYVKGTHDFLGLNYYYTYYVVASEEAEYGEPDYFKDVGGTIFKNITDGPVTNWDGFRTLMNYLVDTYDIKYIVVTENGMDSGSELVLDDDTRVNYLKKHINAVAEAIDDGVDVRGYFAWSFMDNLEWSYGYDKKYGLYQVDFDSPNRPRTARNSVEYYKTVIETRNPQLYADDV